MWLGATGRPIRNGKWALRWLTQVEDILLDPVYTGKAFADLLDLAENGAIRPDEPVIFRHTGGLPALFAFESWLPRANGLPWSDSDAAV
jgi:D-cysteine desulfhydrase